MTPATREMTRPDPEAVRSALTEAARLDREWYAKKNPGTGGGRNPFMPFPLAAFIAMLAEAVPDAPGNRFLDVGAGPGSKMLIARDLFGLDVAGIECYSEPAAAANAQLGLLVTVQDASVYAGYGNHDLIWLYRPYSDPGLQAGLEKRVTGDMAPGAVLIGAHLEAPPPGWAVILDDWELRRGIWMKPPAA